MKILIYMGGGFDTYGPSRHLYNALIEDLLTSGHTVHLIESHSSGNDPDAPKNLLAFEKFSYETVSTQVIEKKAFAKRYLTGVKYCFDCIPIFKKQKGFDVMMVQSCPWAPFAVSFAKKYVKIPTVWNIQDMFPGASIANGAMRKKWMQKFFYCFQKIAYRKADHISVISEDMKRKVMEQGVTADKITVIPDWYDDKSVEEIPWENNLFVKKYGMKKEIFYIQYAGTMGFNFDYNLVIEVAELLKEYKDIVFQMIGQGSQKNDFMAAARKHGLENIVFLPLEPQEMVSHVYSACSVCLIPLPYGVIGNSVPSKTGLLMACHRVIVNVGDKESDWYDMFEREKIGVSVSNKDPKDVAAAVLKMKDHPELREQYADNAREFAKRYFSRTINTALYEQLYDKIGGGYKYYVIFVLTQFNNNRFIRECEYSLPLNNSNLLIHDGEI